jgi:flagellar assembly factor FliW
LLVDPTQVDPEYPLARVLSRYPFGNEEVAVATVVTRPADGSPATTNLAAPLLIGMSSRKAVQVILDDERLSLRAPLVPEHPVAVVCV